MKDLHSHLLPGLDDGAQSLADTEKMLRAAADSGISVIAATSHYSREMDGKYDEAFEKAAALAEKYGVQLLKGTEYDLEYVADVPREKLRPIGDTKFLLVDMNRNYIIHSMTNLFFELKLAGFKIVFAHPERMLQADDLEKLLDILSGNDIYVQMDSGSLIGRYGHHARKNAFRILDRGGCHLLGNDAHKPRHFLFRECRALLEKRYGRDLFELLTEENPSALLAGEDLTPSPRRKSFWDRLLRRRD